MSQEPCKSARGQKLKLNSWRSEVLTSRLLIPLSAPSWLFLIDPRSAALLTPCKTPLQVRRETKQGPISAPSPRSSYTTALFKLSACQNVVPAKAGQDSEPNPWGLLVRIRLTVFDLAGGLRGMEGVGGREDSFSVLERLEGKALIGWSRRTLTKQQKIHSGLIKWMGLCRIKWSILQLLLLSEHFVAGPRLRCTCIFSHVFIAILARTKFQV